MGLLSYLRGTDLLEDRSAQPAGEARTLAMGEQSETLLYPTNAPSRWWWTTRTCCGSPMPGRASALGGSSKVPSRPGVAPSSSREPSLGWTPPGWANEPDDPGPDRAGDGGVQPPHWARSGGSRPGGAGGPVGRRP